MLSARRQAFVLATSTALVACGAPSIPRPTILAQQTSALIVIPHEPPPGRAEHAPPEPLKPGVVWVDGEWAYHGRKWWWTPGRWVIPPEGATYSPWCTVRATDGTLYFAPASWHDAKGGKLDEPKAVSASSVESGIVVDPEGNIEKTMVVTPK